MQNKNQFMALRNSDTISCFMIFPRLFMHIGHTTQLTEQSIFSKIYNIQY